VDDKTLRVNVIPHGKADDNPALNTPLTYTGSAEELDGLHFEIARFNLGEVEDVIDDGEQRLGGRLDHVGVAELLGVEPRVQQEIGHADDAVHGGANLVTHVGEKLALGPVRGFGRKPGFLGCLLKPGRFLQLIADGLVEGLAKIGVVLTGSSELRRDGARCAEVIFSAGWITDSSSPVPVQNDADAGFLDCDAALLLG